MKDIEIIKYELEIESRKLRNKAKNELGRQIFNKLCEGKSYDLDDYVKRKMKNRHCIIFLSLIENQSVTPVENFKNIKQFEVSDLIDIELLKTNTKKIDSNFEYDIQELVKAVNVFFITTINQFGFQITKLNTDHYNHTKIILKLPSQLFH